MKRFMCAALGWLLLFNMSAFAGETTSKISDLEDVVDRLDKANDDERRVIHDRMVQTAGFWTVACIETAARTICSTDVQNLTIVRLVYCIFETDIATGVSDIQRATGDSRSGVSGKTQDIEAIISMIIRRLDGLARMYPLIDPDKPGASYERAGLVVCMALVCQVDKGHVEKLALECQRNKEGNSSLPFTAVISVIRSVPEADIHWPRGMEDEAKRLMLSFRICSGIRK